MAEVPIDSLSGFSVPLKPLAHQIST